MKRLLLTALLASFTSLICGAATDDYKKVYFGGGIGLNYSNKSESTNISLLPLVGYRILKPLSVGVQLFYAYESSSTFKQHGYGAGAFTRFDIPVLPLHLHAEYDYLRYQTTLKSSGIKGTGDYHQIPVGFGGYVGKGRFRVGVTALWDLLHVDRNNLIPTFRFAFFF
ncbi:MAG: hypothetical protein ACRC9X_04060 [Bacteroidales bacterium]